MLLCFIQSFLNFALVIWLGQFKVLSEYLDVTFVFLTVAILLYAPIQSQNRIHYNQKKRLEFKAKALMIVAFILYLRFVLKPELYNTVGSAVLLHTIELSLVGVGIHMKGKGKRNERVEEQSEWSSK